MTQLLRPGSVHTFEVSSEAAGVRLDKFVAAQAGLSRRLARQWIGGGAVQIRGQVVRVLTRPLRAGTRVVVTVPALAAGEGAASSGQSEDSEASAADEVAGSAAVPLLHMDEQIVVILKPAGLLSETDRHGGPSVETVLARQLALAGERKGRLWLVHRLDAGTSGVMVLARTAAAARALGDAFREGTVRKRYLALCAGQVSKPLHLDGPIGRVKGTRHGVRRDGKPAVTDIEPLAEVVCAAFAGADGVAGAGVGTVADAGAGVGVLRAAGGATYEHASFVRALPRTGRTHQIRVHLAHAGHPLLGDGLYGGPRYVGTAAVPRFMLHASRLAFPHPKTGALVRYEAALPKDFVQCARLLGLEAGHGAPRHHSLE